MANTKDALKRTLNLEIIDRGADKVAEEIYKALPKPKSTGGKIALGLLTIAGAFVAKKMVADENGNVSREARYATRAFLRGYRRRSIYDD